MSGQFIFDLRSESYCFILAIMHFCVKMWHVSAFPLKWALAINPNFRVSVDGLISVCYTKCHSGNTFPIFTLIEFFFMWIAVSPKMIKWYIYIYIYIWYVVHLDQDFADDHPWWIINLHMNCEAKVRRKYNQRLQQKYIHFLFWKP